MVEISNDWEGYRLYQYWANVKQQLVSGTIEMAIVSQVSLIRSECAGAVTSQSKQYFVIAYMYDELAISISSQVLKESFARRT